jgi:hypothetical protein
MKTAKQKVKELYEEKVKNGLIDVKFDFYKDKLKTATEEQLYQEILQFEESIQSGNYEILDFGDSN